MVLAAASPWLYGTTGDREEAILQEMAAQARLNSRYLNSLQEELDHLSWQVEITQKKLSTYYGHFELCSTWKHELAGDMADSAEGPLEQIERIDTQ